MPTYRKEGKDLIIFATADDHKVPSTVVLPEPEPQPGLILPNGEINWNCPCLGGMATGPCGIEFREAFSCFHNSEADPKGSDCLDAFKEMQLCMAEYPQLYSKYNDDDRADLDIDLDSAEKAMISENSMDQSVEKEKPVEKKSSIATEPKKDKSSPVSENLNKEVQSVNA